MATIKGSGAALTHNQMDANFNEVTSATTNIATLQTTVAGLQTHITALQAELDANQQSAENITTGVIARINTAKAQVQTYLSTYQALPAFSGSGSTQLDGLLNDLIAQIIVEFQATITDLNAQITLLSEDFTI
jgi:hypothetical protein